MASMPEEIVPRDTLQKILHLWWLPFIAMLIGGLCGYVFHLIQPPLYESQAVFTFSLDYGRLGKLSDVEEDQLMGAAGAVIDNTLMVNTLLTRALAQELVPQGFDFVHQISIERKSYRWVLRVRNPDAKNALRIASMWSELSQTALSEASQHAEKANLLQHQLDGLESCLEHMAVTEPAAAQCAWPSQADLQREISALGGQFQTERTASQGLLAGLGFQLSDTAQLAAQPIVNGRNTLVLAGGLLGFAAGVFIASRSKMKQSEAKGSHAGKNRPRR